jgi:RHS repeat-associated protein
VIAIGDSNHYKFTGKERDAESELDNFGARYNASSMGRFMSPDPLPWLGWQHGNERTRSRFEGYIGNPQNFNLYSYVRNNPTTLTDPAGMYICNGTNNQCAQVQAGLNNAKEALKSGNLTNQESAALQKVVNFYGKAGDANGVVVQFGNTTTGASGGTISSKVYNSNITTITLNNRTFAGLSTLQAAELEIHEGTHGIDGVARGGVQPTDKAEKLADERNAYRTQSYVPQGLGVVDGGWGLWDPAWPAGKAEGNRNRAVDSYAQKSTAIWCAAGGDC